MLRACGRHFSRPTIEWRTADERQESRTSYQTEPWLQYVVRDVDRLRVLPSGSGNREEERKYVRVNQKLPERGGSLSLSLSLTRLPSRSLASRYEMNPRTGKAPWIRPMCKGMELSLPSRRGTIEIEQVVLGNLATHATKAATRLVRKRPMCVQALRCGQEQEQGRSLLKSMSHRVDWAPLSRPTHQQIICVWGRNSSLSCDKLNHDDPARLFTS